MAQQFMGVNGIQKFSSIVTDNPANMKQAWTLVEQKYPHVFCHPCAAHNLNLLLKDIGKIEVFAHVMENAKMIVKYFDSHHVAESVFASMRDKVYKEAMESASHAHTASVAASSVETDADVAINSSSAGVDFNSAVDASTATTTVSEGSSPASKKATRLKMPGATRWGSNIICIGSLLKNMNVLQRVAIESSDVSVEIKDLLLKMSMWNEMELQHGMLSPIRKSHYKIRE